MIDKLDYFTYYVELENWLYHIKSISDSGDHTEIIEAYKNELKTRIYPVANKAKTIFYGKDGKTQSVISIENPNWKDLKITDVTTNSKVSWEKKRFAFEFDLIEGHNYRIY